MRVLVVLRRVVVVVVVGRDLERDQSVGVGPELMDCNTCYLVIADRTKRVK